LLKGYDFKAHTERTITSSERFLEELSTVRAEGYGRNDREEYDHFLGISAPIFNYMAEPIAVLNIWTVFPRHTIDDLIEWSPELRASASRVTQMIGGALPSI